MAETANTAKNRLGSEAIVTAIPILNVDEEVARVHAGLFSDLAARGQIIGAHDLWIAATAMSHNHAVLTANTAEFIHVEGLEVIQFA